MFNQLCLVTSRTCYGAKILTFVDMEAKERIKKAYEFLRSSGKVHTQQDVADIMMVKKENISRAFNGNEKYLTPGFIERFNKAFGGIFNTEWLINENGNMLNSLYPNCTNEFIRRGSDNYLLVPLVHIDSVGGMDSNNSIVGESQHIEGYVPFVNAQKGDKAIFQSGTSMIPTIPPGSIMQIRKVENWREYFGYGNIFVIELTDGRRITKEVRKYSENPQEYVWCVSHNPEVEDEELPKSMIVSVWKVIKILTDKGW